MIRRRIARVVTHKRFVGAFVALVAITGIAFRSLGFAATGQMYVSPTSASVLNGNNVTVSVRLNPGTAVNSVDITLSYDTSKLQFVSVSSSGSSFPSSVTETGGGGTVQTARFIGGGGSTSADGLIVQATFKALVGSGSATLSLAGSNAAYNGAYTDPSLVGATISFTSPAPAPAPAPSTPSSPAPTQSQPATPKTTTPKTTTPSTPAPTATPSTPAPTAQAAPTPAKPNCKGEATGIQFTSASVHITCEPASRAFVKFGTDGKLAGTTQPTAAAAAAFDVNLSGPLIRPGSKVSYSVVGVGASGEQIESATQTFSTKGYKVKVKALDKNQKPIGNKQFTLHSDPITAKSDASGVITFENVAPGKHTLEVTQGKKKLTQELTVDDTLGVASDGSQYAGIQNFSLLFSQISGGINLLPWVITLLLLALIGGLVWMYITGKGPLGPQLQRIVAKFNQPQAAGPAAPPTAGGLFQAEPPQVVMPASPPVDGKDETSHDK